MRKAQLLIEGVHSSQFVDKGGDRPTPGRHQGPNLERLERPAPERPL